MSATLGIVQSPICVDSRGSVAKELLKLLLLPWLCAPDIAGKYPPFRGRSSEFFPVPCFRFDCAAPRRSTGQFAAFQFLSCHAWSGLGCQCECRSASWVDW